MAVEVVLTVIQFLEVEMVKMVDLVVVLVFMLA